VLLVRVCLRLNLFRWSTDACADNCAHNLINGPGCLSTQRLPLLKNLLVFGCAVYWLRVKSSWSEGRLGTSISWWLTIQRLRITMLATTIRIRLVIRTSPSGLRTVAHQVRSRSTRHLCSSSCSFVTAKNTVLRTGPHSRWFLLLFTKSKRALDRHRYLVLLPECCHLVQMSSVLSRHL
jgi:hypothetical protein